MEDEDVGKVNDDETKGGKLVKERGKKFESRRRQFKQQTFFVPTRVIQNTFNSL